MATVIANVAKGWIRGKTEDDPTKFGIMLLKAVESDALLATRTTIADLLAHNTEADFTNYARKTGLTATSTVDQVNNWATLSVPNQTWAAAGGAVNNTLAKLVIYYDQGGTNATRIPVSIHDFVATTDGNDLQTNFNIAGFYKAS